MDPLKIVHYCGDCNREVRPLKTSRSGWRHKRVTPEEPEWEQPCDYKPPRSVLAQ